MARLLTQFEVLSFFQSTRGVVTKDALVKRFDVSKKGKEVRLAGVLDTLENQGKIVKLSNGGWMYATYAEQAALEANKAQG